MQRPTKESIELMKAQVIQGVNVIRAHLTRSPEIDEALGSVETFIAIALRVFAVTNPSKLKEHMQLVELQHYLVPGEKKRDLDR